MRQSRGTNQEQEMAQEDVKNVASSELSTGLTGYGKLRLHLRFRVGQSEEWRYGSTEWNREGEKVET